MTNILYFVLGIFSVLVVGSLTVGVVGFFKAIKNAKDEVEKMENAIMNSIVMNYENLQKSIDEVGDSSMKRDDELSQVFSREIDELNRSVDSRFDKFLAKYKLSNPTEEEKEGKKLLKG